VVLRGRFGAGLAWYDRAGKPLGTLGEPGSFVRPAISPDGRVLVVDRLDPQTGTYDLWEYDLVRGGSTRLTFDPRQDWYPVFAPDGAEIVFSSNRGGRYSLYRKSLVGAGNEELLLDTPPDKFPSDWSSDGRFIIFYQNDPQTRYDVWALPLAGDRKPFPLLATPFNEHRARLSPDGRWLAYSCDETGRDEVYVRSFPKPGGKWRVSVEGGSRPVWRRDGRELFYIAADRKLMAAAVKAGAPFETEASRALFETRQSPTRSFDISPDGRTFLLIDALPDPVIPPMTLLENWPAALARR